ncbi:MAG: hypothetical protein AAF380_00810 [Bacteroidota bacterium]
MKISSLKPLIKSIFVLIITVSSCKAQEKYKDKMPHAASNAELDHPKKPNTKIKLLFFTGIACCFCAAAIGMYSLAQPDHTDSSNTGNSLDLNKPNNTSANDSPSSPNSPDTPPITPPITSPTNLNTSDLDLSSPFNESSLEPNKPNNTSANGSPSSPNSPDTPPITPPITSPTDLNNSNPEVLPLNQDHEEENTKPNEKSAFAKDAELQALQSANLPAGEAIINSIVIDGEKLDYKRPDKSDEESYGKALLDTYYEIINKIGLIYLSCSNREQAIIRTKIYEAANETGCLPGAVNTLQRLLVIYQPTGDNNAFQLVNDYIAKFNIQAIEGIIMPLIYAGESYSEYEEIDGVNYIYLRKQSKHIPSCVFKDIGYKFGIPQKIINVLADDQYSDLAKQAGIEKLYEVIEKKVKEAFQQGIVSFLTTELNDNIKSQNHWLDTDLMLAIILEALGDDTTLLNSCFNEDQSQITEEASKLILKHMNWLNKDGTANLQDKKQKFHQTDFSKGNQENIPIGQIEEEALRGMVNQVYNLPTLRNIPRSQRERELQALNGLVRLVNLNRLRQTRY